MSSFTCGSSPQCLAASCFSSLWGPLKIILRIVLYSLWTQISPESAHTVIARHRFQSWVVLFLVLSKFFFVHENFWTDLAAHSCGIPRVVCSVLCQRGRCWEIFGALGTEIQVELMNQLDVVLQDWPCRELQVAVAASKSCVPRLWAWGQMDCSTTPHGDQLDLK